MWRSRIGTQPWISYGDHGVDSLRLPVRQHWVGTERIPSLGEEGWRIDRAGDGAGTFSRAFALGRITRKSDSVGRCIATSVDRRARRPFGGTDSWTGKRRTPLDRTGNAGRAGSQERHFHRGAR